MDKTSVEKAKSRLHTAQEELSTAKQELGAYIQFGRQQPGDPMNDPKVGRMSERIKELEEEVSEAEAELQLAEEEAQSDLWAQEQAKRPQPSAKERELQAKYEEIAKELEKLRKTMESKRLKIGDEIRTGSDPLGKVSELSKMEIKERDLVSSLHAVHAALQAEKAVSAELERQRAVDAVIAIQDKVTGAVTDILKKLYALRNETQAANEELDKAISLVANFQLTEFGVIRLSDDALFLGGTYDQLDNLLKRAEFSFDSLVKRAKIK